MRGDTGTTLLLRGTPNLTWRPISVKKAFSTGNLPLQKHNPMFTQGALENRISCQKEDRHMRNTLALIFSLISFISLFQSLAFSKDDSDAPAPQVKGAPTSADLPSALATILTASPATP